MPSIKEFMQLDLRVAEILSAENHPNADRLYVLKVKVGDQEKQLVAGIRSAYTLEELVGKKVVVVNNLDSAVIRGVESQGMVLAASHEDKAILLTPCSDVPSGAQVK
jgi:methionine--tRNA ligase beta chain